jgi:DNA repair protein RadD
MIDQIRGSYIRGTRSICAVLPTGGGKTFIGARVANEVSEQGGKVLWIAHRQELCAQARARLRDDVAVETVQTLLTRESLPDAALLVIDESHHFPEKNSWTDIPRAYPDAKILGLTATPQRGDGAPLGAIFEELIAGPQPRELIAQGHLVPVEIWGPPTEMDSGTLAAEPVRAWAERYSTLKTAVFATSNKRALELAHAWRDAGYATEVVQGSLCAKTRAAVLERWRSGETQVVVSVHCLTEGFDLPAIECVALTRKFSHVGAYLQVVGRGMRPSPGKTSLKVLDLTGSTHAHGHPEQDRVYSLTGKAITIRSGLEPIRQCLKCGTVFSSPGHSCPRCGQYVARPLTHEQRIARNVRLGEITAAHDDGKRAAAWEALFAKGKAAGYKMPGWALVQYKLRYGTYPERKGS